MEIKRVTAKEEFDIAFAIRVKVFVEEQGVPIEEEADAYDKTAVHLLAYIDGRPVGCGRVYLQQGYAKIGRLAVLKPFRSAGVGRALCLRLIETAEEMGAQTLVLDAQLTAIGFYSKLGFSPQGGVFLDGGIEHKRMRKELLGNSVKNTQ